MFNTISRLFSDIRFIYKIKEEFVMSEISDRLQKEIDELDYLFNNI